MRVTEDARLIDIVEWWRTVRPRVDDPQMCLFSSTLGIGGTSMCQPDFGPHADLEHFELALRKIALEIALEIAMTYFIGSEMVSLTWLDIIRMPKCHACDLGLRAILFDTSQCPRPALCLSFFLKYASSTFYSHDFAAWLPRTITEHLFAGAGP